MGRYEGVGPLLRRHKLGADCHDFYIEEESGYGGPDWSFVAQIETGRDYRAFGVLAGVRMEGLPHIAPRGYPSGLSWRTADHAKAGSGACHSETWLTTNEMVEAQMRYVSEGDQPYDALEYAIAIMRLAEVRSEGKRAVRAVFCFDN